MTTGRLIAGLRRPNPSAPSRRTEKPDTRQFRHHVLPIKIEPGPAVGVEMRRPRSEDSPGRVKAHEHVAIVGEPFLDSTRATLAELIVVQKGNGQSSM